MPEANGSAGREDRALEPAHYRDLVRATISPLRTEFDEWEREGHIPRQFFQQLGESGVFRERWRCGAAGGHHLARVLIEELTPLNGGVALATSIHSEVFIHALAHFGSPGQKQLLEDALSGQAIGCFAATEATAGSDLTSIQATARAEGDGWRLRAEKRYTTNAGRATHVIVLATITGDRDRPALFCLPLDLPGVMVRGYYETLGVRSADTCVLSIDALAGPDDLLGKPGHGLGIAFRLLDYERLAASAGLLAGAEVALRLARTWGRRRVQFASRLLDHQALRHRLADRWADLYAARSALDATCARLAMGQMPHVEIAATKLLAARAASLAIDETLQVFGARGYTSAFPIERMYRDVRLTRIGGGSDEVMRNIVAAFLDTEDAEAKGWVGAWEQADNAGGSLIPQSR